MERKFQEELDILKEQLLSMAAKVERNIGDAIQAFRDLDRELADDVRQRDAEIDLAEVQIDDHCLALLALHQPVARDLRFIATGMKIVKDMERIGDMAVNISEHALELIRKPHIQIPADLAEMGRAAQKMLKNALDSFVNQDPEFARQVILQDDQVDQYHRKIIRELIEMMVGDTSTIDPATHVIYVNKFLERIGDHSANIAEMVVFMVEGKDIRHWEKLKRITG